MKKTFAVLGLVIGIPLMVVYVTLVVILALPLSRDPNRAIIGNGDFWFEYYFAKMAWIAIVGACVSAYFWRDHSSGGPAKKRKYRIMM